MRFRFLQPLLRFLLNPIGFLGNPFRFFSLFLYPSYRILEIQLVFSQKGFRSSEDFLFQSKLSRNFKGVGLSRQADSKVIGGRQCLHIELHGGVFHFRGAQRILLQLRVMGSSHHQSPALPKFFQLGDTQRRTFCRIRSGTQLIQQYQRFLIYRPKDFRDVLHMSRKRTETLLDALLISDIRKHFLQHRKPAFLGTRYVQAALCH